MSNKVKITAAGKMPRIKPLIMCFRNLAEDNRLEIHVANETIGQEKEDVMFLAYLVAGIIQNIAVGNDLDVDQVWALAMSQRKNMVENMVVHRMDSTQEDMGDFTRQVN